MMKQSELDTENYRRIFWINCLLSVPLLLIFAWPYSVFCDQISASRLIRYPGALCFSFPFMLTILHGHVTLALGSAHRHHYYRWLHGHPLTYGLLFHPVFTSTRFRLVIFSVSILLFLTGWITGI